MLVHFAIDPAALEPTKAPLWQTREVHQRCIETWMRHGVLVHPGRNAAESEVWTAISRLPQQLRTDWQVALKHGRLCPGPDNWGGLAAVTTGEELNGAGASVAVACIEETRAALVGLPDEELSMRLSPDGPEVVRFSSMDRCGAFRAIRDQAEAPIPEGIRVTELWQTRFRPLAKFAKQIAIVDRYSAENWRKGFGGLDRLVKEIDGAAQQSKVTVYSSIIESGVVDLEQAIRSVPLARGGVREIEAYLIPDREFSQIAHDRFLRFDDSVVEIGIGVEVFDGSSTRRPTTFALKPQTGMHRDIEKRLRSKTSHTFRYSSR